jgi:hypothetical protein
MSRTNPGGRSDPQALLAYELAREAQDLIYVMAGINALAEVHRRDKARKVHVVMYGVRRAIAVEAREHAESSPYNF